MARSRNPDKLLCARARAIFDADVATYGATQARCSELCPPPLSPAQLAVFLASSGV